MSRSFLDEAGDLSTSPPTSPCSTSPGAWMPCPTTPPPTAGERERTGGTGERRGGAVVAAVANSPGMEAGLAAIAMEAGCGDDFAMEPRGGVAAVADYPILPYYFFAYPWVPNNAK